MGHSDITTMNIYSHIYEETDQETANVFEKLVNQRAWPNSDQIQKNTKNLLTVSTKCVNIYTVQEICGCGGTGRRAGLRRIKATF